MQLQVDTYVLSGLLRHSDLEFEATKKGKGKVVKKPKTQRTKR